MWLPMHRRPSFACAKKRRVAPNGNGVFLDKPVTTKLYEENVCFGELEVGHSSMQGLRAHMEDRHIIATMSGVDDHVLVAVMDGHAGTYAAIHTSQHLQAKIEGTTTWLQYIALASDERKKRGADLLGKALVQAYLEIDESLRASPAMDESGCTAVTAIVTPTHIVCASVGDSRCVVGCSDAAVSLSEDHKPSCAEERARIEEAGGFVLMDRVNGELAMSRALGDFRYKQDLTLSDRDHMVIAYPDVAVHCRRGDEQALLLACDGVWDVMANEEGVAFVTEVLGGGGDSTEGSTDSTNSSDSSSSNGGSSSDDSDGSNGNRKRKQGEQQTPVSAKEAARALIDLALAEGSTDNISAIVVRFPAAATAEVSGDSS